MQDNSPQTDYLKYILDSINAQFTEVKALIQNNDKESTEKLHSLELKIQELELKVNAIEVEKNLVKGFLGSSKFWQVLLFVGGLFLAYLTGNSGIITKVLGLFG